MPITGAPMNGAHRPGPLREADAATELPLAGIRVVELATIIATPLGTSFLADMGAEVIKIEQIGGDPFRGMLSGLGAARVNGGKHSISVNMKTPEGIKIVRDLIRDADVVVHNFRPGVPERLGIAYEQVATINPDVVYLQANGYGPDGPSAHRPSTHPIPGAAMGGVMYQMGGRLPDKLQDIDGLEALDPPPDARQRTQSGSEHRGRGHDFNHAGLSGP